MDAAGKSTVTIFARLEKKYSLINERGGSYAGYASFALGVNLCRS